MEARTAGEPLKSSLVRICSERKEVHGAGFLISEREVMTCAHVVADVLGISRDEPTRPLDMVHVWFLKWEQAYRAEVVEWMPGEKDVAVLRLEHKCPAGRQPAPLIADETLEEHSFRVIGFPKGHDDGVLADGVIKFFRSFDWQIEGVTTTGYPIQPGFSGAPVWDDTLGGVVGMITEVERKAEPKAAFMLPMSELAKPWFPLADSLHFFNPLDEYRRRLLDETRFVNFHGIPLPRDRSGRAVAPEVPLDKVYIRIQALEEKRHRAQEKDEARELESETRQRRHSTEHASAQDFRDVLRLLGEYFYRRGEVYQAAIRPESVDPEAALREFKRLVILGAPGAGKSTMLRYFARRAAERTKGPVPILVPLRDYATALSQDSTLLLHEFALRRVAAGDESLYQSFSKAIATEQVLWLLDGLDETRNWTGQVATQAGRLPGQLILTSRPVGYDKRGQIATLPHFEIQPLETDNVNQFLHDWFGILAKQNETTPEWIETRVHQLQAQLKQRPRLQPLMRNPLLLTFFVILSGEDSAQSLPHHRAELYRRYVEELLDRWEASRRAEQKEHVFENIPDLKGEVGRQAILQGFYYLGWHLHLTYYGGQQAKMPNRNALVKTLADYCRDTWGNHAATIAATVLDFWLSAGLLSVWPVNGQEFLAFRHLTFQEYAAAWGIAEAWRRDRKRARRFLRPRLHHYAWREPILLLVGILNEDELNDLVGFLLRGHSRYERSLHRDLRLAGALLAEGALLDKKRVRQIIGRLRWLGRNHEHWQTAVRLVTYLLGVWVFIQIFSLSLESFGLIFLWTMIWVLSSELNVLQRGLTLPVRLGKYIPNPEPIFSLLAQIGSPAIRSLFPFLNDWPEYDRVRAAQQAVTQINDVTAIPELIDALQEENTYYRSGAIMALGRLGGADALSHLTQALQDQNLRVRRSAAIALGRIGDERAVMPLTGVLRDWYSDYYGAYVAESAALALGRIGDEKAVPHLIRAIQGYSNRVAEAATIALGQIGAQEAVPHLIYALQGQSFNFGLRGSAALALGQIGDTAHVPLLIQALHDQKPTVRSSVATALGQIGDASAVPSLIQALHDKDFHVQEAAAKALGQIGDAAAVPYLLQALQNHYYTRVLEAALPNQYYTRVHEAALEALDRIGDTETVDFFVRTLQDKNPTAYRSVAEALEQMGLIALPYLLAALQGDRLLVSKAAARALEEIGDTTAVTLQVHTLQNTYAGIHGSVAKALEQIGASALPDLLDALKHGTFDVRQVAAEALGKIGGDEAVSGLIQTLRDSNPRVRKSAASALGKIGDKKAVKPLIAARGLEKREVIAALKQVGDESAIPYLSSTLHSLHVYPEAATALGELANKSKNRKHLQRAGRSLWWLLSELNNEIARAAFTALESVISRITDLEVETLPISDPLA